MPTEAARVARKAGRVARALLALAVGFVLFAAALVYSAVSRPDPWSPLGPYPTQQVLEPRDNTDTPFVSLSDPVVHVAGEKCVEGDGFTISGTVSW